MGAETRLSANEVAALDRFVERLLLLREHGASEEAILFYAWLYRESRYQPRDELTFKQGVAAAELRCSEPAIRNRAQAIEKLGLLHKHRGGGRGVAMAIALDDPLAVLGDGTLKRLATEPEQTTLFEVHEPPVEPAPEPSPPVLRLVADGPDEKPQGHGLDPAVIETTDGGVDDPEQGAPPAAAGGLPSEIVELVGQLGAVGAGIVRACRLDWAEPALTLHAPSLWHADLIRRQVLVPLGAVLRQRWPTATVDVRAELAAAEKPQGRAPDPAVIGLEKPQGRGPDPAVIGCDEGADGAQLVASSERTARLAVFGGEKPQGAQQPTTPGRDPLQGSLPGERETPSQPRAPTRRPSADVEGFLREVMAIDARLADAGLYPWIVLGLVARQGEIPAARWRSLLDDLRQGAAGPRELFRRHGVPWLGIFRVKTRLAEVFPELGWSRRWERRGGTPGRRITEGDA